jgi:hypothetical protein
MRAFHLLDLVITTVEVQISIEEVEADITHSVTQGRSHSQWINQKRNGLSPDVSHGS